MNDTKVLISLLDAAERRDFVSHLRKRNKRNDAKNILLFNAFCNNQSSLIKKQMTTNAYNVLKKRLTDRLIDFTSGVIIKTEQTTPIEIMKLLVLSRRLFTLKHFKTAYKQLDKAASKATEISDYHLLNEIYQTYIQYSFHPLSLPQTVLFKSYEKNKTAYANYANLNMVYALIRKAFQNQEQDQKPLDLEELVSGSFELFGITNADGYTFQTLNQIAEIADITGSYNRNYYETDLFFEKHIGNIQGSVIDNEKELTYHINLLYLVAHIYFRKKQFAKSLQYLQNMCAQMIRYDNKYYSFYEVKYTILVALNKNFSGNHRSAATLLDAVLPKTDKLKLRDRSVLQAILARTVIHFQQEEFTEANRLTAQLWQQDKTYIDKLGLEWLINKKFIEILIAIELENTSYVDSLIASLRRKKSIYFKGPNQSAIPFLKLIETYHKNPEKVSTESFAKKVKSSFDFKPSQEEDLFFMSYYAWLKSKMTQQPLYEVTLNLIAKSD